MTILTSSEPAGHTRTPRPPGSTPRTRDGVRPGATRVGLTHLGPTIAALDVAGEIDLATVDLLAQVLLGAVELPRCRELRVDLSDVDFLGAAGIGMLARAHDRADVRGMTVRLVGVSRIARRALEITRATECFDTWPGGPAPRP